jgi:hypothetical protein
VRCRKREEACRTKIYAVNQYKNEIWKAWNAQAKKGIPRFIFHFKLTSEWDLEGEGNLFSLSSPPSEGACKTKIYAVNQYRIKNGKLETRKRKKVSLGWFSVLNSHQNET